jgi:hypothetical protein
MNIIDEYIAKFEGNAKTKLLKMRNVIKNMLPVQKNVLPMEYRLSS